MSLTLRSTKGSALTHTEMDENFSGFADGSNWGATVAATSNITLTGTFAASGLITASGGLTVASGQTLTLTGGTVDGTPTWSSDQAITLSTAAQPNVTSMGTLAANLLFID